MSTFVQIRNVPEKTRRQLKERAATRGQSLNAYLLDLIHREVERPTPEEVFARAAARHERATASSVSAIAEGRRESADR